MYDGKLLFEFYQNKINECLSEYIPDDKTDLSSSMRYSLLCGGKRIRPVITLAFCELCGGSFKTALPFACAVEMVHTYSLIFDDLPSMDNDDYRRGQLSNHKVYGEAMSMLAGLGLYSKAFDIVNSASDLKQISSENSRKAGSLLAQASGINGIVTGQALDIKNNGEVRLGYDEVLNIHKLKTSAMLEVSAVLGCLSADADEKTILLSRDYAVNVGLAFQIRDDILDVVGTETKMGKSIGKDKKESKTTFVDIFGIEKSQEYVREYTEKAKEILSGFKNNEFLLWITDMLCNRES